MKRMQLNIAGLQNFSTFCYSTAAGCLLFMFLGKCGVKQFHVKIFRFYKVVFSSLHNQGLVSTYVSMN